MGVVSVLKQIHWQLQMLCYLHTIAAVLFYSYYPQTRSFPVDYVSSPALQGIPVTQRFKSAEWWILSLYSPAILIPLVSVGFTLVYWKARWRQIFLAVFLALALAFLFGVFILRMAWIGRKNDPLDPDNPASSYARCCTSEYYLTVPSCRNHGSLTPECNPPYAKSDLGTNGDEVYFVCFTVAFGVVYALMLLNTVRLMRATYEYLNSGEEKDSGDSSGNMGMAVGAAMPAARPIPALRQPFAYGGKK